jgi:murein DD-endopeptidase MepM/ murein hydrolase activator NlpD
MANEFYTLIVVPHAKARFRKVQVSVRLIKWVAGGVGTLALIVMGVLIHYSRIAFEVHELRRLRTENSELRERTQAYEQNAGKLQSKLEQLQGIVNKLGVMAGLEQSLPSGGAAPNAGVGGPTGAIDTDTPPIGASSLVSMDKELTSLTARSEQLEAFYRDQSTLLASTPSVWPVRGYLSAGFGNRADPFTGQRDFHPGIDVSTPIGTRVVSPADGLVVSCAERGAYGNSMIIDHGFGIVTRYGHLSGYNVKPGARVRRGDVIGFVGSTGRSTGPHLHYEVWVRDQAQNPIHYILDEYRSFG